MGLNRAALPSIGILTRIVIDKIDLCVPVGCNPIKNIGKIVFGAQKGFG
jgi:hypothetical protein